MPSPKTMALQRLLRLTGADCRVQKDTVLFRITLSGAGITSLLNHEPIPSAAGYSVGEHHIKLHDPPELACLPLIDVTDCNDAAEMHRRIRMGMETVRLRAEQQHQMLAAAGLHPMILTGRPVLIGCGHVAGMDFEIQIQADGSFMLVSAGPPGHAWSMPPTMRLRITLPTTVAEIPRALHQQVERFCVDHRSIILTGPPDAPTAAPPAAQFGLLHAPPLVATVPTAAAMLANARSTPPSETAAPVEQKAAPPGDAARAASHLVERTDPAGQPERTDPRFDGHAPRIQDPTPVEPAPQRETTDPRAPREVTLRTRADDLRLHERTEDSPASHHDETPADSAPPSAATAVLVLARVAARLRETFRHLTEDSYLCACVPFDEGAVTLVRLARPAVLIIDDEVEADEVALGLLAHEVARSGGVTLAFVAKGRDGRLPISHAIVPPVTDVRLRRVITAARRSARAELRGKSH